MKNIAEWGHQNAIRHEFQLAEKIPSAGSIAQKAEERLEALGNLPKSRAREVLSKWGFTAPRLKTETHSPTQEDYVQQYEQSLSASQNRVNRPHDPLQDQGRKRPNPSALGVVNREMDSTVASILSTKGARSVLPQLERARGLIAEERSIVDAALKSALARTGGAPELKKSSHAGPQQRPAIKPARIEQPPSLAAPEPPPPAPYENFHPSLRSLHPLRAAAAAPQPARADADPAAPYQRLRDAALRSLRPLPPAPGAQPLLARLGASWYLRQVFGQA